MALKKITPNDEINPSPYNDTDTVLGIDLIDRDHSKIIDILNFLFVYRGYITVVV